MTYNYQEEGTGSFLFRNFWWVVLGLAAVVWFRTRPGAPTIEVFKIDAIVGIIFFMIFFWKYFDRELRLRTPKIVWIDGFSTTKSIGWYLGEFSVFTLGDIDYGVSLRGRDGVIIAPSAAVNMLGHQVVINARLSYVDFSALPFYVQEFLVFKKLNGPYLFGIVSEEHHEELDKAELVNLEKSYTKVNELNSTLMDINEKLHTATEDTVEAIGRIGESIKDTTRPTKRFDLSKFRRKDEEQ